MSENSNDTPTNVGNCAYDGYPCYEPVARTETFYMDDHDNAATQETATQFVTCDYDAEGNLICESFGFIDRDAVSDPDKLWDQYDW